MCDFTTARQLAGFFHASVVDIEVYEAYILEFAEYYHNQRMIEMVADVRFDFEQRKLNKPKIKHHEHSDRRA